MIISALFALKNNFKGSLKTLCFWFFILFSVFGFNLKSFAANAGFTYQGRILNPDGTPVTASAVELNLQITGPQSGASTCVMYSERHTVDLSATKGVFNVIIGRGVRTDASSTALDRIFSSNLIYPHLTQCSGGYVKQAGDSLYLNVSFNDGSGVQTLPGIEITQTPSSMDTMSVAGIPSQQVLRVDNSVGAANLGSSNYAMNLDNFTAFLDLINGTSSKYAKASSSVSGNSVTIGGSTGLQPQVTLIAPSTTFTSYSLSLPTSKGSNGQVLTSDGTGGMFWSNVSGGSGETSPWALSGYNISYSIGDVGIGTTTPWANLQVNGTSPALVSDGQLSLSGSETSGAAGTGGGIVFNGNDGVEVGRAWGSVHSLKENSTIGDVASYMRFSTRTSGAALAEKMRISSTGNVGIGTPAPNISGSSVGPILSLLGQPTKGTILELFGNDVAAGTKTHGVVYAGNIVSGAVNVTGLFGIYGGTNADEGNFLLFTKPSGSVVSERLRVTSEGNVGIGTSSPDSKLTVNGSLKLSSGDLTISSLAGSGTRPLSVNSSGQLVASSGGTASSGQIIQTKWYALTGGTNNASGTTESIPNTIFKFTPLTANSMLLITLSWNAIFMQSVATSGIYNTIGYYFYRNGNYYDSIGLFGSNSLTLASPVSRTILIGTTSTAEMTFELKQYMGCNGCSASTQNLTVVVSELQN